MQSAETPSKTRMTKLSRITLDDIRNTFHAFNSRLIYTGLIVFYARVLA